jgi:hypothetical protein
MAVMKEMLLAGLDAREEWAVEAQRRPKRRLERIVEYSRDGYMHTIRVRRGLCNVREYHSPSEESVWRFARLANRIIAGEVPHHEVQIGTVGDSYFIWCIIRREHRAAERIAA